MTDGPIDAGQRPDAPSLGAVLANAREAAGLTVEQVSASTRIRSTLVRDLESDRYTSSGGAVYARGHLRALAGAVGLDAAPLLARFDAEQGRPVPSPTEVELPAFGGNTSSFRPPVAAPRERRGPRWGTALVGAAAVLVAVLAIGTLSSPGRSADQSAAGPTPSTGATTPAPAVHTPAPNSLAAKPAVTGAQLRLRLVGGSSWVSVRNAAGTLFEGVLSDGQFKDFTDPSRLKVIVGNAAAVDLNCGGHDGGPAGGSGRVLRFACTKDGLSPA